MSDAPTESKLHGVIALARVRLDHCCGDEA